MRQIRHLRLNVLTWATCALAAGCGGARAPGVVTGAVTPVARDSTSLRVDSLGAAIARAAQDSEADQQVLDSLHQPLARDSLRPPPDSVVTAVKPQEVEREAVRLFGPEGPAAIGAAPVPEAGGGGGGGGAAVPTFDIDVSSFAAKRRVLEYLEFFQVDARDRFEIWLARLGRYEGMIREKLRAKGLPEDLVYLTLIESGLSNTAVSRAKAVGM